MVMQQHGTVTIRWRSRNSPVILFVLTKDKNFPVILKRAQLSQVSLPEIRKLFSRQIMINCANVLIQDYSPEVPIPMMSCFGWPRDRIRPATTDTRLSGFRKLYSGISETYVIALYLYATSLVFIPCWFFQALTQMWEQLCFMTLFATYF